MSISLKNITLSISGALILTACGGGGSSTIESSISSNVNTSISTNYSQYAWGINPNIDSTFKTNYNIDSIAHVNVTDAWGKTKGNSIKVAVIDEDFEVNHPDIKDKIIYTYNTKDNTSNVSGTNYVNDKFSHGTAVSGTIASSSLGVAPDVKLILINIDLSSGEPGDTSFLTEADLIEAFDQAQAQGAKVINCSWGGGAISQAFKDKLDLLKAANITVVFSSGNGDSLTGAAYDLDLPGNDDQSELDSVIGVGATAANNDVTYYSNYGSKIDVIAPGGGPDVFDNSMIGVASLDLTGTDGINNANTLMNNNYSIVTGTSFSAPITSGVIALMLAVNPNLTADRIRTILTTTTIQVGGVNGANYSVGNFDTRRAYGKIDASAAVQQAEDDLP
jgi:subtilisin family serine protease